jgi:mannitol-specific phosphotransferase system IIBC component
MSSDTRSVPATEVSKIAFVCEAGMGSSLIGANQLKKKLKKAGFKIKVVNSPAHSIPGDAQILVVHQGLANQVRAKAPDRVVIAFQNFVGNPVYDQLVQAFKNGDEIVGTV